MNAERLGAHIQIVGWNHQRYLESCIRSCRAQTVSTPVVYVDNASGDGSVEYVRREFPMVKIVENVTNRGYAGGHNDGLRHLANTAVAILLNPDIVLDSRFVEEILKPFRDEQVGAVVPLLLRGGGEETRKREEPYIDSYGTRLLLSLRAVHVLENKKLSSVQKSLSSTSIWGFTGAAVAVRRSALADVAVDGEAFDEGLFAYREDVDLSWRLHHREWRIVGAPLARATHERQVRRGKEKSVWAAQLSWRNSFLVLVKNVPLSLLVFHSPFLCAEMFFRLLQLFATPRLWPALPTLFQLLPQFVRKRARVLRSLGAYS